AVWAARDEWQKLHRKESEGIAESLQSSLEAGLGSAFDQVVSEAAKRSGLPNSRMERYFRADKRCLWKNSWLLDDHLHRARQLNSTSANRVCQHGQSRVAYAAYLNQGVRRHYFKSRRTVGGQPTTAIRRHNQRSSRQIDSPGRRFTRRPVSE